MPQIEMEGIWMDIMGPKTSCFVIHPGSHCSEEIELKCLDVIKKSSKLYAVLYMAIFVLKFKKIYREGKFEHTSKTFGKDYLWSLVFMSWIVGGMKLALCILNKLGSPLDGTCFFIEGRASPLLSILGSPSILFLSVSKKEEVVYFTFVRACRSADIFCKKRNKFTISSQKCMCFIALYGLLSYFILKNQPISTTNNFEEAYGHNFDVEDWILQQKNDLFCFSLLYLICNENDEGTI